jgi:inhibitor of cysteine peptidase
VPKRIHQVAMLLALAAAGTGLAACGGSAGGSSSPSPSPKTTYTEAQSGQTVKAAVGDEIFVTLKDNPSTGYQWHMEHSAGLTQVSSQFAGPSPSPSPMVGAGGMRTWVFKVAKAGSQSLKGDYARPWESVQPATTFTLTVDAT